MPAGRRPQPRRETRSLALACFLMGAETGGGPGWLEAAPPGPRPVTDSKPRRSPRLNRKLAGAAAGPRGAPRAWLPRAPGCRCARWFLARPLPLARPILLARAAPSRTRGSRPAGRKAARRREVGGHRSAALAMKAGLGSKLSAAAGDPGREGALGTEESAESPAGPSIVLLFLCSGLSAHCSRSWGGVRMRASCPRCSGPAAHPQSRCLLEPESASPTPQPPPVGAREHLCSSPVSTPAQAAWVLSSSL